MKTWEKIELWAGAVFILIVLALVITNMAGCKYDPISGPDRQHNVRTNAFGLPQ